MKYSLILDSNTTFELVIEALDAGGVGFLAFIDENKKLLGISTDGDIRRALLKKDYSIDGIINRNPEVMNYALHKRDIVARLKSLHRRQMPLINQDGLLESVFTLDDVDFASKPNRVVIMAGGLGSRLGDLTQQTPKPMLMVGDRPMLQHQVETFREYGFRNFSFCVNYKKDVIKDYFKNGAQFGVNIDYIEENQRMGTAGALSLLSQPINDSFFVINADVLTSIDLAAVLDNHVQNQSVATMCVRKYEYQVPFGVVKSDETCQIYSIEEKPQYSFDVNTGVYVLEPEVLDLVPQNEFFDMPNFFEVLMANNKRTTVFRINDYWIDIGRKEDLNKANLDMQIIRDN